MVGVWELGCSVLVRIDLALGLSLYVLRIMSECVQNELAILLVRSSLDTQV